jgi:hypothetical protein
MLAYITQAPLRRRQCHAYAAIVTVPSHGHNVAAHSAWYGRITEGPAAMHPNATKKLQASRVQQGSPQVPSTSATIHSVPSPLPLGSFQAAPPPDYPHLHDKVVNHLLRLLLSDRPHSQVALKVGVKERVEAALVGV